MEKISAYTHERMEHAKIYIAYQFFSQKLANHWHSNTVVMRYLILVTQNKGQLYPMKNHTLCENGKRTLPVQLEAQYSSFMIMK